jgi:hypothetical protein
MSQVAVGDVVELCWSAGDGGYYDAIVTAASAAELTFEYVANADWAACTEVVDVADLPQRVRATRRKSGREKKLMLGSYRDLEDGIMMRRKDTAEFAEMLKGDGFAPDTLERLRGEELTVEKLVSTGFRWPWVVKQLPEGMKMPSALSVEEVAELVGEECLMPVLDVGPQAEVAMTLGSWREYWRAPYREQRLNVTSLEVTGTRLAELVRSPAAVRALDWIDTVWPAELKQRSLHGILGATSKFGITDARLAPKRSLGGELSPEGSERPNALFEAPMVPPTAHEQHEWLKEESMHVVGAGRGAPAAALVGSTPEPGLAPGPAEPKGKIHRLDPEFAS